MNLVWLLEGRAWSSLALRAILALSDFFFSPTPLPALLVYFVFSISLVCLYKGLGNLPDSLNQCLKTTIFSN